jgi:tRNA (guanine10-N2)-methyltransferase
VVDTFGHTLTQEERVARIERFSFLDFQGPVRIRGSDFTMAILEDYGHSEHCPNNPKIPELLHVYFGEWVSFVAI